MRVSTLSIITRLRLLVLLGLAVAPVAVAEQHAASANPAGNPMSSADGSDNVSVLTFDEPGAFIFEVTPGVTELTIEAWGGGGGGGTAGISGGGGGGGGAYAQRTIDSDSVIPVVSGKEFLVQVGAGGEPGQDGNDSRFSDPDTMPGIVIVGMEGLGGDSEGGGGGTGSAGTVVHEGGSGGTGGTDSGGGGGGSAFPDDDGGNGSNGGTTTGGAGGEGFGNGGNGAGTTSTAQNGNPPGGGGGGANTLGDEAGSGASGRVVVRYPIPQPDPEKSTITADPETLTADGQATADITVQLIFANGDAVPEGGDTVELETTLGSLSTVTDHGDGTYSATLTAATTLGTATLAGTLNGEPMSDEATVEFVAGGPDRYLVNVDDPEPLAGRTVTITAQLADANDNPIAEAERTVNWSATGGGEFNENSTMTDADGAATVQFTTNSEAGSEHVVTATDQVKAGVSGETPVITTGTEEIFKDRFELSD